MTLKTKIKDYKFLLFNVCDYSVTCGGTYAALHKATQESQPCLSLTSRSQDDITVTQKRLQINGKDTTMIEFAYNNSHGREVGFHKRVRGSEPYSFCLQLICDPNNLGKEQVTLLSTQCSPYTVELRHAKCKAPLLTFRLLQS